MRYFNVAAKVYLKLFYRQHYLAGLHLGPNVLYQTGKDLRLGLRSTGAECASHDANIAYIDILQIDLGILAGLIAHGSYGIEILDAKYLAEDLIENEPELVE